MPQSSEGDRKRPRRAEVTSALTSGLMVQASLVLMALAVAVQTKGFGSWFVSAMYRVIVFSRSSTDRKTPRLRLWRVSLEKKPSTALSQEHEVGVKWNVQRG